MKGEEEIFIHALRACKGWLKWLSIPLRHLGGFASSFIIAWVNRKEADEIFPRTRRSHKIHFYHLPLIIISIFYHTHGVDARKNYLWEFYSRLFLIDHLKLNGVRSPGGKVQRIRCAKNCSGADDLFGERGVHLPGKIIWKVFESKI